MSRRDQPADTPGTWTARGQNSDVSFDGTTIVITRSWNAPGGKGESAYPLRQIAGVDLTMPGIGSVAGKFTLVVAGGVQRSRGQGFMAARRDPLTVQFTHPHRGEFEALAGAVRAALAGLDASSVATPPAAAPAGLAEQIAQLAALHAQHVLTDAEFAAAKARLLGTPAGPQDQAPRAW